MGKCSRVTSFDGSGWTNLVPGLIVNDAHRFGCGVGGLQPVEPQTEPGERRKGPSNQQLHAPTVLLVRHLL